VPSADRVYLSPLRYPGGKGRLGRFVGELVSAQSPHPKVYVEPFTGGAGVGLRLLLDEYVDEIVINDLNPGIAAFWRAVLSDTNGFLDLLRQTPVTIDSWHEQHARYASGTRSDVELGFATFFLNRTNRSGILDARPIGGLDQKGKWKVDARFNKAALTDRIRAIARYTSRITVCERDGIDLIQDHLSDKRAFIYADPPYLKDGDDLYMDTLGWSDHQRLARILRDADRWFLTYDADPRVTDELYLGLRCAAFHMSHTAADQHVGQEYAVFAPSLKVPSLDHLGSRVAEMLAPV
jgi:DNA adenine methylase